MAKRYQIPALATLPIDPTFARLCDEGKIEEYDVDVVVLYGEKTSLEKISQAVNQVKESGESVVAVKKLPEKLKYRRIVTLD